jgi:hypothetical protein
MPRKLQLQLLMLLLWADCESAHLQARLIAIKFEKTFAHREKNES